MTLIMEHELNYGLHNTEFYCQLVRWLATNEQGSTQNDAVVAYKSWYYSSIRHQGLRYTSDMLKQPVSFQKFESRIRRGPRVQPMRLKFSVSEVTGTGKVSSWQHNIDTFHDYYKAIMQFCYTWSCKRAWISWAQSFCCHFKTGTIEITQIRLDSSIFHFAGKRHGSSLTASVSVGNDRNQGIVTRELLENSIPALSGTVHH
jgi:hypothetical protein